MERGPYPQQDWPNQMKAGSKALSPERVSFIRKTYSHLMVAIFACVAMISLILNTSFFEPLVIFMVTKNWLLVLAIFMGLSWAGDMMARQVQNKGLQYLGLIVGVGAYAVILTPLMLVAQSKAGVGVLFNALILTGLIFSALTVLVFISGQNFSVLRVGLGVGSILALGAIVAGVLFGFNLGLGFSIFMVGLSAGTVLYYTSEIVHTYDTDQHVAASLALFSSIGMLFWYLVRILMAFSD